jgi:hypothetical protein
MDAWVWIVIGLVIVVALVAWFATQASRRRRTAALRSQFGDEYDRIVETADSPREAESELEQRRQRREMLEIRPLPPGARLRYVEEWRAVQARFVDDPAGALAAADTLVTKVMSERGYPMEDFDQRTADISVDHPRTVADYRAAHDISTRIADREGDGEADTEEMRQAMVHYRSLFDELLEELDAEVPGDTGDTRTG